MQRLLDEKKMPKKISHFRVAGELRPVMLERFHGGKLLVAVEAEGEIIRRVLGDRRSDTVEALEVGVGVAADLDFEMPQAVRPDTLVERLRQRVVQLFPGRYRLAGQRVGQADRVARQHLGQRLFR